jgi:phosphopantetheinyl transferase
MPHATGFDGFGEIPGCKGRVIDHADFAEQHPDWQDYLEEADRDRAGRLVTPKAAGLLALSLAAERYAISELMGIPLNEVSIRRKEAGVPYLDVAPGISLSISRTAGASGIAIDTLGRPVGVDIERIMPLDYGPMLGMICTQAEQAQLRQVIRGEFALLHFLRLWTLKEAALKALGQGLQAGAKNVEVEAGTLMAGGPAQIKVFDRAHAACLMDDDRYVVAVVSGRPEDQRRVTAIESGAAS